VPDRARIARSRLRVLLRQFPAVAILGARQVGKSTLARTALAGFTLLDLEDPGDFRRLEADPLFVLGQQRRVVIDEAQRLPTLFPVLRSFLDRHPRHQVVLLGSASPGLVRQISESLAGRIGILELGGISLFEEDAERLWIAGGYPRVHWSRPRARPLEWYPSYLRTCLERDVPQLGYRVSATRMRNLLTLVANGQGSVCNLSELGAALGLNYHSVAHLLDIFEGIFLVRRLPPFFANVRKRLVKAPKLYLRDTGLLHTLLGIPFARRSLLVHPKAGASFETFAIEQILQHARLADPAAEGFFYRTHGGVEVDLVLRLRGRLLPIEIKLGTTPPSTRNLERCMQDLAAPRGWVVNLAHEPLLIGRSIRMAGLREFLERNRLRPRA